MKLPNTFVVLFAFTFQALAAPAGKTRSRQPQQPAGNLGEVLKPFDKNGNQQIDADELVSVQQAFSVLGKLDKNSNGEIELAEVATPKPTGPSAAGRARAGEGLKRADKNGNGRIDPDELEGLQQMLVKGPGEFMKKLDQNGNGKLEENEVARLNERISKGGSAGRPGSSSSTPSFRRPPEKKPSETTKPAETIKPAEKPAPTESTSKPDTPPNKFGT